MKKSILFLGLALVMLAVGCTKETTTDLLEAKRTIGVSIDETTRTSLADTKLLWSKGDVVKVVSLETSQSEDVAVPEESAGKSSFNIQTSITGQVMLIYPAEAYNAETKMVELPSSQKYVAGSIANNLSVLYGVTATNNVALTCAQSFIKISANEALHTVILQAVGDEPVSGSFSMDEALGLSPYAGISSLRVSEIAENTKSVVLAIPGGEYTKGFKLTIRGTSDSTYRVATAYAATGKTLKEGHLITMPELNLASLPQTTDIIISDLASLKDFLATAAAAPAESVYSIVADIDCGGETLTPAESFAGTLNGNGFAIKNANISALVSDLKEGGVVKNVVIDESVTAVPDSVFGLICTLNEGTIKGCVNNADIAIEGVGAAARFGAIVGSCSNTGRVYDCINNGDISVSGAITKQSYFGGVVGQLAFTPTPGDDVLLSNCVNNGTINVEAASAGSIFVGGVLGGNNAQKIASAVNLGNIESCINKGSVRYYLDKLASGTYANVGGVIGYFEGDVAGLKNYARVEYSTIEGDGTASATCCGVAGVVCNLIYGATGCENYGEVYANGRWAAGTAGNAGVGGCHQTAVAGVIAKHGTSYNTPATEDTPVTNCANYGKLSGNILMKTGGGTAPFVGGVLACTNCSISNLKNYGDWDIVLGGKNNYTGGVVGYFSGASITDCANYGNLVVAGHPDLAGSAVLGGVAGNVEKVATLTNCTNEGDLTLNEVPSASTSYQYLAGVMGNYGDNSQILTNCVNKGTITSNCTRKMRIGGITGAIYDATQTLPTAAEDGTEIPGVPGQKNMTDCVNYGDIVVNGAGNPADTTPGSIIGGLAGYGSIGYTRCQNLGNITLKNCAANTAAGLFVGGANRCYNVNDCTIDGELSSDVATNLVGFFAGMPYTKDNKLGVRYTIGAEEAVTIAANAKVNGVGIVSPVTAEQICGHDAECLYIEDQFIINNVKTSSVPECDVKANLYYVSEILPSYSSQFPDYSSLAFVISSKSKDVKTVTTLLADKETIEYYLTSKGYTLEQLVAEYGTAFKANELAEITTGGTYLDVYTSLDASTEYELAVVATNSYDKAVTVFDVKATKEAPQYSGELVIGDYTITDTVSLTGSEQTFTVLSKDGTDSNISIKNLAYNDNFEWYATYDKSQNTVTLNGMAYGYESYGSIFLYTLYNIGSNKAGYWAGNSGSEPIVFGVDPSTHQITNLQTDYALFAASGSSILGYFRYFGAGVATIVKSGAPTKAASNKPFISAREVNITAKKATIGNKIVKVNTPMAKVSIK
ncbi:MAG: hypothetical protein KBS95_06170 [Alistipes sp.]|nr:hypothetical protein [Candidatus Alistipes equi]